MSLAAYEYSLSWSLRVKHDQPTSKVKLCKSISSTNDVYRFLSSYSSKEENIDTNVALYPLMVNTVNAIHNDLVLLGNLTLRQNHAQFSQSIYHCNGLADGPLSLS